MELKGKKNKLKLVGQHMMVLFLITILLSIFIYFSRQEDSDQYSLLFYFFQAATGIAIIIVPPVYTNVYVLIPLFLAKKRYASFGVFALLAIAIWGPIAGFVEPWTDEHWFGMPPEVTRVSDGFFAVLFMLIISTLFNLSYRWYTQLSRIKQIENDRLNIELSLLKNQINPHFFFNTLNNLYSLALEKADETPQVILKLSEMMRYTIYDCKESQVQIGNEISYLENYIALQKIRNSNGANIKFEKDIADSTIKIAPMLLIVFLENAFKHGLEIMLENAFINIELRATEDKLQFNIENSHENADNEDNGGLGLENVRRRLSLIYPERHTLKIENVNRVFKIELSIQLNK